MRNKTCKHPRCTRRVWGKGYCDWHQYLREDKKKPNKAIRNKNPISSRSSKNNSVKGIKHHLKEQWGFKTQRELFDYVWETRNHVCQFTGENLEKVPKKYRHWCCMHILPKGLYTFYKLNPGNIVLGLPEFHTIVDNWTEDQRKKHPDWDFDAFFKMQEEMKVKYKRFIDDNML